MFEELMLPHLSNAIGIFLSNPFNVSISVAAMALALLLLTKLTDKSLSQKTRITLIYVHLAFLFTPLVLFAVSLSCQSVSLTCAVTLTQLLIYSIPIVVMAALTAGLVLVPWYYEKASSKSAKSIQSFVNNESRRMGLAKTPQAFSFDSGKPFAFSTSFFKPRIFISVGMQEVLTKKEMQAVLLHELAHVKNSSAWFKFSSSMLKIFSPFAAVRGFGFSIDAEEQNADAYAIMRQKTLRHINSAKKKVSIK